MRISLNWLQKYVDIKISTEELANKLTMVGFEVESVEYLGKKYDNFVIGEVLNVNKHPNADKLTVCNVNIGSKTLQIICGAPNVKVGQKVAVGLIGAEIPRNQHDANGKSFKLSQIKIRGVESYGMICSEYELDIGDDKDGIMVLRPDAKVGTPLAEYLGLNDIIFEIGITPNRPDAMSHIGIAREVAAILNEKVRMPTISFEEENENSDQAASIRIKDFENCPRYTARVVKDVKIVPSPKWMQELLSAVGVRPVNNIVDVTNFVLMECGHPLHAFDLDKVSGKSIIVECAKGGETFETIDHKKRNLRNDTLMICDGDKPIAIAGVMGGANTEITDTTTNILIESAYFNPRSIRRTSKYFNLSTDASQRFSRGADPNITKWAVDRCVQLIQEIANGKVLKNAIDVYPTKIQTKEITLRVKKVNEILGTTLDAEVISELLQKIEIETVDFNESMIRFRVPTFRPDLEREIDLIEEVARLYGYDNIKLKETTTTRFLFTPPEKDFLDEIRSHFIGRGLREIITNSMQNIDIASIASDKVVKISNPISKDMEALRTSLVPSALEVIKNNIFHGSKNLKLFEIGKVYLIDEALKQQTPVKGYFEEDRLILIFSGSIKPLTWDEKTRFFDIFDVKGEIVLFFKKVFLDNIKFIPYPISNALSDISIRLELDGRDIGVIGKVRTDILKKFEIEQDVFFAEIKLGAIIENRRKEKSFTPLSKYPVVSRDIALIVKEDILHDKIENEIWKAGYPLITKVELFDIYQGEQIGIGNKSYAFTLEFMAEDHTMTQDEIEGVMNNIIINLEKNLNASVRK